MKIYLKFFSTIFISLCTLFLGACSQPPSQKQDGIIVLSLSSNGQYVIASTLKNQLKLFDIKNHSQKLINKTTNIYSAYFIKNSDEFMWQNNDSNQVTIQTVTGEFIRKFNPGFPTYGEIITSDLKDYIASDVNFNLFLRRNNKVRWIKLNSNGFYGFGKLLNLKLSNNDNKLLTCGGTFTFNNSNNAIRYRNFRERNYSLDSVVLWNLKNLKPIFLFPGHVSKTFAIFSSDSNFIVTGDESVHLYLWNVATGKKIYEGYNIHFGKLIGYNSNNQNFTWDSSVLKVKPPSSYHSPDNIYKNSRTLSLNFVDKTHYLRFIYDIPYAILYSVNDPSPLKYLKLNTNPYPSINSYVRDESIDSSWQTHTVVVGHATDPGITVYKYDPAKQTLHVIWNTA